MEHDCEIKGMIFDYGGTLDTGGCHWGKVLWHAYQRAGVPVGEQQFREAYVHAERTMGKNPIIQPDYTFRQTLSAKLEIELDYLAHLTHIAHLGKTYHQPLLDDLYAATQRHTAHSREVLSQLKARYPMVLVSNFYGNIATVLAEFGLQDIFSSIVESAVVGVRKPDPQIFRLGVEALGLRPGQVTVVGDSMQKDIVPARTAGCKTVWIKGEGWTDEPEDETIPDLVVTDLAEILNYN